MSPKSAPQCIAEDNVYVELTDKNLDATIVMNQVKSPQAGAIVLFAGMLFLVVISFIIKSDLLLQEQLGIISMESPLRSFNTLHTCL